MIIELDNEKSKNEPYVWEQMYLDRILEVTGFRRILSKNIKDGLYAKWYNKTSVYGFAVAQKVDFVSESYSEMCYKCGKPLGKQWKKDATGKPYHLICPASEVSNKVASSYDIETTHPNF